MLYFDNIQLNNKVLRIKNKPYINLLKAEADLFIF
jgi:hypothetical protein